jgi:ketosteroid isomerase-like protein
MQKTTRAWVCLLALLLPQAGVSAAQLMPGGRIVDVGRLRGDFYSQMTAKVREVMDSWQEVWRKVGDRPLQQLYSPQATLLQPGGMPLNGREEIGAFSETAFPVTSALRTGMQDLEACEGFAYLSGYYAIDPIRPDRGSSSGRHFTLIQQEGGRWLIRLQFFLPDSGAVLFPYLVIPGLMAPLTNDEIRAGPRGPSRFAAFGDAQYVLMAFRDAWKRGDAADAASFIAEDAWVQLPNETENRAGMLSLEERLKEGMDRFSEILSVELDFDRRDRLSVTFGRYHATGVGGPDKPGHFLMLLRNAGDGWLIRSLVFS